jgi:hypothetical protein
MQGRVRVPVPTSHCSSGWSLIDDRAPGPTDRKQGTKPVTKGVRPRPRSPRIIAARSDTLSQRMATDVPSTACVRA